MDKNILIMVGEWAQSRVASGEEPPWTFHKLQQLADISLSLADGMDATQSANLSEPSVQTMDPPATSTEDENIVTLSTFRREAQALEVALPT